MDPDRDEMPDIDIDICQDGRPEVIEYVRQKYGHVAQIITFGTLKARAAVRDVGRVLGVPLAEVDAHRQADPRRAEDDARQGAGAGAGPQADCTTSDPQVRKVIDIGQQLEGLARHAGVHAAGVVIADEPLDNFVPLYKQADSDDVITQLDGPSVEKVGLLKMDFLGLRTLTRPRAGPRSWSSDSTASTSTSRSIDLDDQKVYELFAQRRDQGRVPV